MTFFAGYDKIISAIQEGGENGGDLLPTAAVSVLLPVLPVIRRRVVLYTVRAVGTGMRGAMFSSPVRRIALEDSFPSPTCPDGDPLSALRSYSAPAILPLDFLAAAKRRTVYGRARSAGADRTASISIRVFFGISGVLGSGR